MYFHLLPDYRVVSWLVASREPPLKDDWHGCLIDMINSIHWSLPMDQAPS